MSITLKICRKCGREHLESVAEAVRQRILECEDQKRHFERHRRRYKVELKRILQVLAEAPYGGSRWGSPSPLDPAPVVKYHARVRLSKKRKVSPVIVDEEIKELKLSERTLRCLERAGIRTMEQLCHQREANVLMWHRSGRGLLKELSKALKIKGRRLGEK